MPDQTRPSPATREAEARDAEVHGAVDEEPTPEEEAAADRNEPDPAVAESAKEMYERGANQQGEGRID
ncbi:MAG: hypothetical protein AB7O29_08515 [Acidimicrobiia bacterium]